MSTDVIEIDHEVIEILSSSPPPKIAPAAPVRRPQLPSPLRSPRSPKRSRDDSELLTSSPLFDFEKRARPELAGPSAAGVPRPICADPEDPGSSPHKKRKLQSGVFAPVPTTEGPENAPRLATVPSECSGSSELAHGSLNADRYKAARLTTEPSVVAQEPSAPCAVAREASAPYVAAREASAPSVAARESSAPSVAARESSAPPIDSFAHLTDSVAIETSSESLQHSHVPTKMASEPAKKSSAPPKTSSVPAVELFVPASASSHAPKTAVASTKRSRPVQAASRTSTIEDPGRPLFVESASSAEPKASSKGKRVAAATKVSDRKSACEKLVCELWADTTGWKDKLEAELTTLDVSVQCQCRDTDLGSDGVPDGVSLVVTAHGNFEDEWDDELGVFVKCAPAREHMRTAVIVLDASVMDTLGHMELDARAAYFESLRNFAVEHCCADPQTAILYMIPEVGVHFKKQAAKFNREMRKMIASSSACRTEPPPDEHFYTNLETELQVMHGIRAYYPRKAQDAAEMIANCVVDMGYARYHALLDETHDAAGAYVRSKSTTLDVTIESLTKIQGLPPRIAARLGSEAKSLGRIRNLLGSNSDMRRSRLKLFGKGNWNEALLAFLEDEDPKQVI